MTKSGSDQPDFDYATFVSRRAVGLMEQLRIAPTPANYAIWFNYCLGNSPELKRSIDSLFETNTSFDESTSAALVSTFGDNHLPGEISSDVPKRLSSVMKDAQGFLQTAIADNRTQMQAMGTLAGKVDVDADPRELIEGLVTELSKSVNRASKLEMNFVEANRELSEIRACLDEAEQRAKTDVLTGLSNRLAFEEFFRDAQAGAGASGNPLSVLLIDVDHFKRFNDDFGHAVGDEVLRLIARVVRERVRDQDFPARYGGEELVVVLPNADLAACAAVGENIRKSIGECTIKRRSTGANLPPITVSVGAAQWRPGETMADLIDRCDDALYGAKDAGRNRVLTAA